MRLRRTEDGRYYAEARGGMEKLKPSGGTAAEPTGIGGTPSALQVSTQYGWIRTFATAGSVWSGNLQFSEGNYLAFSAGSVNDAWYFGSDTPFSRIGAKFQIYATWTVTMVHEYWSGAAWAALTTQEAMSFTTPSPTTSTPIDSYSSWQMPSDWAPTVVGNNTLGNVLKYWMRIRISVSTAITTLPLVGRAFISSNGMRELYLISQQPYSLGPNGTLLRYDQSAFSAGTAQYFSAQAAMYSAPESIPSLSAYRGRLFITNLKETVRWDGRFYQSVGNVKPGAGTSALFAAAGTAGTWRHYIAWGYGPLQNESNADGNVGYRAPLYGVSQAVQVTPGVGVDPNDANSIVTAGGNGQVTIGWGALTVPSDASAMIIYRTQDLANMNKGDRATCPAYPVFCMNRNTFTTSTSVTIGGPDTIPAMPGAPPAILYDNLPPKGCKYSLVFENRLMLGGGPDGAWFWSDPYFPDQWNRTIQNLPLTRSLGGRDMGGAEFANYAVLFTEDQTWALQHLEADIPTLVPLHPGVGSVAPWATAVGDGYLIWLARDGFYLWDGSRGRPKNISGKFKAAFAKMSFDAHGGSRGVIHDHKYDVTLIDSKNGTIGTAYTLDLETFEWATRTTNDKKVPLCLIHAPLGHADQGVPHALYAKATVGTNAVSNEVTSWSPCVAEFTTQDDGTNFVCSATMVFPLPAGKAFGCDRAIAYYQPDAGWGTPTITVAGSNIGGDVGSVDTGTVTAGTDFSILTASYGRQGPGTTDLKLTFSATTTGSGSVARQRLFGASIAGEESSLP